MAMGHGKAGKRGQTETKGGREERLRTFLKMFFDLPSTERRQAIDFWRSSGTKVPRVSETPVIGDR